MLLISTGRVQLFYYSYLFINLFYSLGATFAEKKVSKGLKSLEILVLDEADRLLRNPDIGAVVNNMQCGTG